MKRAFYYAIIKSGEIKRSPLSFSALIYCGAGRGIVELFC